MQKELFKAAMWYMNKHNSDLFSLRADLRSIVVVRDWALEKGDIDQVELAFALTEIIKAAICLTTNEIYNTDFCSSALAIIRKYSYQGPKLFTCRKCGKVYPASAFNYDEKAKRQSYFCLSCEKEVQRLHAIYAKPAKGKINSRGEIICTAI